MEDTAEQVLLWIMMVSWLCMLCTSDSQDCVLANERPQLNLITNGNVIEYESADFPMVFQCIFYCPEGDISGCDQLDHDWILITTNVSIETHYLSRNNVSNDHLSYKIMSIDRTRLCTSGDSSFSLYLTITHLSPELAIDNAILICGLRHENDGTIYHDRGDTIAILKPAQESPKVLIRSRQLEDYQAIIYKEKGETVQINCTRYNETSAEWHFQLANGTTLLYSDNSSMLNQLGVEFYDGDVSEDQYQIFFATFSTSVTMNDTVIMCGAKQTNESEPVFYHVKATIIIKEGPGPPQSCPAAGLTKSAEEVAITVPTLFFGIAALCLLAVLIIVVTCKNKRKCKELIMKCKKNQVKPLKNEELITSV